MNSAKYFQKKKPLLILVLILASLSAFLAGSLAHKYGIHHKVPGTDYLKTFYTEPGDTFHYCRVRVSEAKVNFEMIGLDKDTGRWVVADAFTISK